MQQRTTGIPAYSSLLLPLLQLAGDGRVHRLSAAVEQLADYMALTPDERAEPLPGGRQSRFAHRVQYASAMLRRAGLLSAPARGAFQITPQGARVLAGNPLHIDRAFLMQFPAFAEYVSRTVPEQAHDAEPVAYQPGEHTPQELIDILYRGAQRELMDDLLEQILAASPAFFERLVLDLLMALGYGATPRGAARVLGRTGDGGLDGIVKEDALGLDVIYVQAKRWARHNAVGRPVVQGFIGSLIGAGASRGVLLTTSRFTAGALEYAERLQNHQVILIDGERLAELMIQHNVGVQPEVTYTFKSINRDYFED